MGCATTTVKVAYIIFNTILAFLGVASIAWIAINPDSVNEGFAIAAYIACVLIVLFAFLGCFAAVRESLCLTATCAAFLLILAILQIVATCMGLNEREHRSGTATVEQAWDNHDMDRLQLHHECCGKSSAQDYVHLQRPIPASCYANQRINDLKALFIDGCVDKLQSYYDSENIRFAIVSWLLVVFELLGFLFAVFLVINFRNKQRRLQF